MTGVASPTARDLAGSERTTWEAGPQTRRRVMMDGGLPDLLDCVAEPGIEEGVHAHCPFPFEGPRRLGYP